MRAKGPLRKNNVLSVRITDQEMGHLQELMDRTRLSASELMREALVIYATRLEWRGGRPAAVRAVRAA